MPVTVATHGGPHVRLLTDAGIEYRVLGEGWDRERSEAFVRSVPGIGPPDQSMWSDDEIRTYVALEAAFFAERGVERRRRRVDSSRRCCRPASPGSRSVAEHAGSFVPPLLERGLLPGVDPSLVDLDLYTGGFNRVADELGVEGVPSFPALLLGDLTLVTEVPEVLGVTAAEIDFVGADADRALPARHPHALHRSVVRPSRCAGPRRRAGLPRLTGSGDLRRASPPARPIWFAASSRHWPRSAPGCSWPPPCMTSAT